jgi:hypothetical protein
MDVKVHGVKATDPIHEGFGEPGHPDQRVNYEQKPHRLGDTIHVIHPIESDWGLKPVKVVQGSWGYGVDRPARKIELTMGLVGSRPTVDRHDRLFFGERCDDFSRSVAFGPLALGEGPRGHVVLHHEALFKLMSDRVRVVGTGHLEKLLEVIGRLSCLAFEVTLDNGDELLIRIIGLLVIIALVTTGSDHDPLGAPLVSFGTLLCALTDCFEWRPSTATRGPTSCRHGRKWPRPPPRLRHAWRRCRAAPSWSLADRG